MPSPPPPALVVPPQGLVNMPSLTQLVPTRRPLSEVSGNGLGAARKRLKQGETTHIEPLEPIACRELPASSFGRVRKASQRLVE